MAHEHGRELEAIALGTAQRKIEPQVLRARQMVYFPVATVIGLVLAFGIYKIATLENTARITTVPNPVNVAVLVTATPQATPTRAPTPVPTPSPTGTGGLTFVKDIQPVFQAKCAACHGTMGGLTLTTYESLMHGGASGPAITPQDPDKSMIIKKMTAGGHPGQLIPEELEIVRKWIAEGAAEQ